MAPLTAINAKAAHPNAAKLFASCMMSSAGQVAHNGEGRASSVLGDVDAEPPPLRVGEDAVHPRHHQVGRRVADHRRARARRP